MCASDEDFRKVVNGDVAENLATCHQDWKFMCGAQHISEATNLREQLRCPVGEHCLQ